MAISRFKFVSPGIFLKEIDKSKTPVAAPIIGPTIIGRSVKGPLMRPVRVESYADFVEVFGEPNPGGYNGDIWRAGVTLAPSYGAYAAKAYLAFNGPITFVRLGGYHNEPSLTSATPETGKIFAGWKVEDMPTSIPGGATGSAGAYGLFVAPISSSGNSNSWTMPATTASLAAIFYVNKGTVGLVGNPLSGSTNLTGSGAEWVRSTTVGERKFTLKVINRSNQAEEITFNFDPASKDFIRNKFNTNPTLINSAVTSIGAVKDYFLGETFESSLSQKIQCSPTSGSYAAVILALQGQEETIGTVKKGNSFKRQAEASRTPWIVAQHKGTTGSFAADSNGEFPVQKLFRFWSLSEGDWNQNNIKISISDIKPSPTRYEKFGSFTISIRKLKDSDQNPEVLEIYTNVNLNPISPNFISKRIGNIYMDWDYDKKRFIESGEYPNNSKYVYVEVDDSVKGAITPDALPFGFYGVQKYKSVTISGSAAVDSQFSSSAFINSKFFNSPYQGQLSVSGNAAYTCSLSFPEMRLVGYSNEDSNATSLDRVYFGVNTKIPGTKLFDEEITEILRAKPANIEESSKLLTFSTFFSLDDVMFSGSTSSTEVTDLTKQSIAKWEPGNRAAGKSITSKTDFTDYGSELFQRVARFSVPMYGGFNGFDITEKEPFSERSNNSPLAESDSEASSYIYNSLQVAIDSVSDPEVVETNIMVIPGIQNEKITTKLIEVCEQRADALAIVDLVGDFKSEFESTSEVKAVTSTALTRIKGRNLNSSYGCCFFPGVLAKDTSANALVSLPSSVVALGVMGSSAALSELWFAPAGFNRGGLSNGAAGFPVVAVKTKLTSKDRDNLYELNVNPIASFPSEGIVVFGQKTLQATPSALDRINVRRLMIYLKKEISRMAATVLFDPNVNVTWARFTNQVVPFLSSVKGRFGLTDFKVVLDETTTTPELIDRNIVYAKIFLKPARAIEFIALDFILTSTGASFDD